MKPIIGIILQEDMDNFRKMHINREICFSLSKCGAVPIGIYPDYNNIDFVINLCDGFILQGGDDFSNYDLDLIEKIYKLDKPLLGICQGMQTMGYWANGSIKTINGHKEKLKKYVHNIKVVDGTLLYKILNRNDLLVNSRHGECVENTDMLISAISDDGIIEAIEITDHKFFIGLQWHPESLFGTDSNSELLFNYFVNVCRGG